MIYWWVVTTVRIFENLSHINLQIFFKEHLYNLLNDNHLFISCSFKMNGDVENSLITKLPSEERGWVNNGGNGQRSN